MDQNTPYSNMGLVVNVPPAHTLEKRLRFGVLNISEPKLHFFPLYPRGPPAEVAFVFL